MKNCNKGFLLYDGMIALLLLTVIIMCFLPSFVIVQQERLTIREQRDAMMTLQEFAFLHMNDEPSTFPRLIKSENLSYNLTVTASDYDSESELCLSWEGSNHREQIWCFSTPSN